MDVSIAGFTFYRPSVSISTQFTKDSDGNNVGQKDTVTINDIVLYQDLSEGQNLIDIFDAALSASFNAIRRTINYPSNSNTECVIKSVTVDGDSDFVHKLNYTVVAEAYPKRELNTIYGDILKNKNVSSLTFVESIDIPYDLSSISTLDGNIYYNKPITYTCSAQVSCNGDKKLDDASDILSKLVSTKPSGNFGIDLEDYQEVVSSINKSSSAGGDMSVETTTLLLPSDATSTLLASEDISESKNKIDNFLERSYRITFTTIEGSLKYDEGSYNITEYANNLSDVAYGAASSLLDFFISNKNIPIATLSLPGTEQQCSTRLPPLNVTGCWNTKNISIENNKSNNSATLNIEQTTQNIGNCDRNGYKIDYNITKNKRRESKVYAEVAGWSSTGYIVQNLNTYKDEYYEYSIDVGSIKNCVTGTEVVDMAKSYFENIDIMKGSGIITNYVISVSNGKCSLKVTQHSGADLSVDTVGV